MTEKLFITGASKNIEWLLPWWFGNFRKHNPNSEVVVFDFGLSEKALDWCKKKNIETQKPVQKCEGWFYKPTALREAKGELKIWIDVDCEVKGDITPLFDFIREDKLSCSIDMWHSWGCLYQTGVVGVKGDPDILQQWEKRCIKPEGQYGRGDQELLWDIVKDEDKAPIHVLPEKYNWLRMSLFRNRPANRVHYDCKVIHWTGEQGKQIITRAIREKKGTIDIANTLR